MILTIPASQEARITGVSHWYPALAQFFVIEASEEGREKQREEGGSIN
jgi:hypothetical protein